MVRVPSRSVSAPTGTRPREPTTTGIDTTIACWMAVRPTVSRSNGASGANNAQAHALNR
jgi:hypothetical protein